MVALSIDSLETGLSCQSLTVRVPGRTLVSDLTLRVAPGRVVAVLGRNGAGKSSTLHALAGLHADVTGDVRVGGRVLGHWPKRALARQLGLLTQASDDPFPGTVLDSVLVGRHPHIDLWKWESEHDRTIARRALADADLAGFDDREVASLSGGERRRLAVAAVLAQEPAVYLLDEPIQQLDPHHQIAMLDLFRALADRGAGIMLSLHDVGLAARFADEALLLYGDGRWRHGPQQDVLTEAWIGELYGTPMRELRWDDHRTFVPA
jgi:iron complex transport system ATP-binding protein